MPLDKKKLKSAAKGAAERQKEREARQERERLEAIHAEIDPFLAALPEHLEKDGFARYGLPDHCGDIKQVPPAAKYLADLCVGMGLTVEVERDCEVVGYSERCSSDLVVRDPARPAKK